MVSLRPNGDGDNDNRPMSPRRRALATIIRLNSSPLTHRTKRNTYKALRSTRNVPPIRKRFHSGRGAS